MGIKGLLPKLDRIKQAIKLEDLAGTRVGIEASSWLFQVLYPCSFELYTKQQTDRYVEFFEDGISRLLAGNVKPVVVFDGRQIPAKLLTKQERDKKRQEAVQKTDRYMDQNNLDAAKESAKKTIKITDDIVENIMKMLRKLDVPYVKSPYEADAQLAFMAQSGVVDYVITEDSDLLVYGSPKVIYKWDRISTRGVLIELKDVQHAFDVPLAHDHFIIMCILSGCDYQKNIPNIGIQRAFKFMSAMAGESVDKVFSDLHRIGQVIDVNVNVPSNYEDKVKKAFHTFKHQVVFDFWSKDLCRCTPDEPLFVEYGTYAGDIKSLEKGYTISYYQLENVWLSPGDLSTSRISDVSWQPDADEAPDDLNLSGATPLMHLTRQAGKVVTFEGIRNITEWTVPALPVLTIPLLLGESKDLGKVALSLIGTTEDIEEMQIGGQLNFFCSASCFITVDDEDYFLLWEWEQIKQLSTSSDDPISTPSSSDDDDEWGRSSEGDGEDVVELVDNDDDQSKAQEDASVHCVGFKVMGVTAKVKRQDLLLEAKLHMSQGHQVHVVLKPEPSNQYDSRAIAVVAGVGDNIGTVGYIARELTRHVHNALESRTITSVQIDHIRFRAFNPPGYYLRLNISKKGRWENEVVRKSLHAK